MLVIDDAGIQRLQKRYDGNPKWLVEVTDTHVFLFEMIGSTKCFDQKWERVEDVSRHVSVVR